MYRRVSCEDPHNSYENVLMLKAPQGTNIT